MKHILLLLIVVANTSFAQKGKEILFVGNGFTSHHGMPQMVQHMIDEQKLNIKIDSITPRSWDLRIHALFSYTSKDSSSTGPTPTGQVPPSVAKILSRKWDMVVLQERVGSMLIPKVVAVESGRAILMLDSTIKSNKSKTVLFQPCTTQKFPIKYCQPLHTLLFTGFNDEESGDFMEAHHTVEDNLKLMTTMICSDSFHNSAEEFLAVQVQYEKIAKTIHAGIAPVGYAYELCKIKFPEIPLYEEDGLPTKQGAYLIACVFFKYFTQQRLTNVKYDSGVETTEATKIRALIDDIPF